MLAVVRPRLIIVAWAVAFTLMAGASWGASPVPDGAFLRTSDIPMAQPLKSEPFATSEAERYGLVLAGGRRWQAPASELVHLVGETVFVFSDASRAADFLDSGSEELVVPGLTPVPRAPDVGEQSQMFVKVLSSPEGDLRLYAFLFRRDRAVVRLVVAQGAETAGERLPPLVVGAFAVKAHDRVASVAGGESGSDVVPKPPPSSSDELVLKNNGGLTIRAPEGEVWRVRQVTGPNGTPADELVRLSPASPNLQAAVFSRADGRTCKELGEETMKIPGGNKVWIRPRLPDGWYEDAIELNGGDQSAVCADLPGGRALTVLTQPSVSRREGAGLLPILGAMVTAVVKPSPPPPPRPDPAATATVPSPPPPSASDGDDDDDGYGDDWDPTFASARLALLRVEIAGAYMLPGEEPFVPVRNRMRAFGVDIGVDGAGVFAEEIIGFALEYGAAIGYHGDGNVPFDAHLGIGFGLMLGPVTLAPMVGAGADTRGAGDELASYQMDAAFYWYPGGRLRIGVDPVALEGHAMRTFRGSITADQASFVKNQTRITGRLIYSLEDGEGEVYVGFRWVGYDGSIQSDTGLQLYPDANQLGGVVGFGLSDAEAFDL